MERHSRSRSKRRRRKARFYRRLAYAVCGALAVLLFAWGAARMRAGPEAPRLVTGFAERPYEERVGSLFSREPRDPYAVPRARAIALPAVEGARTIFGATGRDRRGHIWFGVSVGIDDVSAHLFEYDPDADVATNRGDVVTQLTRADALRPREGQNRIQSRIVEADDGYLYFASMDEAGEEKDGSRLPTWGGHLWRIEPDDEHWEHLYTAREALVAVGTTGRWVYTLGYWDHVLYQYDTWTTELKRARIGAVHGHISRHFLSDVRGHVYVPRLVAQTEPVERTGEQDSGRTGEEQKAQVSYKATLVELDPALRPVAEVPLDHYTRGDEPWASEGITGFVYLSDGSMVFVTDPGYLYRLVPPSGNGAATLSELGWFHPDGEVAASGLFTYAGERFVVGIGKRADQAPQWLVYDLRNRRATAHTFSIPGCDDPNLAGSITRDNAGRLYVGGDCSAGDGKRRPVLLQLSLDS